MSSGLLKGKRILITGGSSGVGKATAVLASRLGAQVVLLARREDRLKQIVSELEGQGHDYVVFDLTQIEIIESMVNDLTSKCGPFDGFVHCAGIDNPRTLKMLKPGRMEETMQINFYSFVEMVRCLGKKGNFCEQNGMSVVAVSAVSSRIGFSGKLSNCASKAALDAAVRCMGKELYSKNIRVNSVLPARMDTDTLKEVETMLGNSMDVEVLRHRQYAGKSTPEAVADVICYLLSDSSRLITGTNIDVSGGVLTS